MYCVLTDAVSAVGGKVKSRVAVTGERAPGVPAELCTVVGSILTLVNSCGHKQLKYKTHYALTVEV